MAISLDNETGKVTVEATTATTRAKVGSVKISVTLNGKTTSTIADVYQKAASASPSDPDPTPEEQNYTYQYSGNDYVTAKCYYKDAGGNLLEQPVPNSGGNACLVLDYSIGVNRYVDGVFVDEVALTYGATLEALSYATFADDECEWWEPTASPLSDWTHNLQYSIGEDVVRGASAVDITFGEAPIPYDTTEKFNAVQFSGIKIKLPEGVLEGLGEKVVECADTAVLEQYYRSYGNATKVAYIFEDSIITLNDVQAGRVTDLASSQKVELAVYSAMHTETTFEDGTVVKGSIHDNCVSDTHISLEDTSNNGLGTALESIYLYDYPLGAFNKVIKEWTTSEFLSKYDTNSFDVYLSFAFSQLPSTFGGGNPNVVIIYNGVEHSVGVSTVIYPFDTKMWTW